MPSATYDPSLFDDIRPYYDSEIPAAMERIAESEFFPLLASYVYPDEPLDQVRLRLRSFRTIRDFQFEVMKNVNAQVLARSTTAFNVSGLERLLPNTDYLYVSNHRDIVLDSSLMQYVLYQNGRDTTEITFGANLMSSPLIIDIGKSNKMFRVERGGSMRDFYQSSRHLSDYIRFVILQKKQSVWIAQRNGRTKDGCDRTDQGIIKMFCLSRPDDKIAALAELNILPVSISYEWEPCDVLKALELYASRFAKYVKKPGEDLNSILTGFVQHKGRVALTFCKPIAREELLAFDGCTKTEYHKQVAALIDRRIVEAYALSPNNFIAHDLRYGQTHYRTLYSPEAREKFEKRMRRFEAFDIDEPDVLRDIFLAIYANPIDRKKELGFKVELP